MKRFSPGHKASQSFTVVFGDFLNTPSWFTDSIGVSSNKILLDRLEEAQWPCVEGAIQNEAQEQTDLVLERRGSLFLKEPKKVGIACVSV